MNSQSARLTWSNWSLYSGTPHNTQTWNAENLILGLTDIIRQLNSHYWWDECIEGLTFRRRKIPPVSGFIYSYDYRWQDPPCRNFDFFLSLAPMWHFDIYLRRKTCFLIKVFLTNWIIKRLGLFFWQNDIHCIFTTLVILFIFVHLGLIKHLNSW